MEIGKSKLENKDWLIDCDNQFLIAIFQFFHHQGLP